jgi:hypothetical protein
LKIFFHPEESFIPLSYINLCKNLKKKKKKKEEEEERRKKKK